MKRPSKAFSLIEVMVAMGVVSVGIMSLVGLLSIGFTGLHKSVAMSSRTAIVQSLGAELKFVNYSTLKTYAAGFPRYYDEEGNPVTSASAALYKATIALKAAQVPGGTAGTVNAQQVSISVSGLHDAEAAQTYCVWIANNGN